MKAWTFQDDKQVKKHGEDKVSWYVGWLDPDGNRRCKSCGPGDKGKRLAEKEKERIHAELLTGAYADKSKRTWADFRTEYEEKVLPGMAARSRPEVLMALDHFERLMKPKRVSAITTATIDSFTAKRRKERGKRKGDTVSPYTVNKDLRHLRAALRKAARWGYLDRHDLPDFDMEREPGRLPRYVIAEHFAAIYAHCDAATQPKGLPFPPADWWRGFLVMAYMTGWRCCELLGLLRDDLDLAAGTAVTRAAVNKGKRDELVKLHPVVVEHLKKLAGFAPDVLPWPHTRRTHLRQFAMIQEAAGIELPCTADHEHSRFCHVYGFHDLRRAFATMNAPRLTGEALQKLMRHKAYATTQRYINMACHLDEAVASLHVPEVLRKAE
jgi:integrase